MTRRPLLSIADLAEHLQVPVKTIYNWNSAGSGPAYRKIGKYVRYRWEDVDRWVDQAHPFR